MQVHIKKSTLDAVKSGLKSAYNLKKLTADIISRFYFVDTITPSDIDKIIIKTYQLNKTLISTIIVDNFKVYHGTSIVPLDSNEVGHYALIPWTTREDLGNLVDKICNHDVKSIAISIVCKSEKMHTLHDNEKEIDDLPDNLSFMTTASQRSHNLSFINHQTDEAFEALHFRDQEINNFKNRVQELEATINGKNTEIAGLNSSVNSFRNLSATKDNEINNLKNQISSLNSTITSKDNSINSLQAQISNLNAQLTNQTNTANNYYSQVQSLNSTISSLNSQVSSLTNQVNNPPQSSVTVKSPGLILRGGPNGPVYVAPTGEFQLYTSGNISLHLIGSQ